MSDTILAWMIYAMGLATGFIIGDGPYNWRRTLRSLKCRIRGRYYTREPDRG